MTMHRSAAATFASALAFTLCLIACGTADTKPAAPSEGTAAGSAKPPSGEEKRSEPPTNAAYAYLAGGCFWGVEHYLERLPGVYDVVSGYMGGTVDNPTYKQVIGKNTGHLETVRVTYDPDKVSYEAVAKLFFEIHDPTQANGQGPDIGPQYLSAVFTNSTEERETVKRLIGKLEAKGLKVATSIRPADGKFWPAEAYHQDYYVKTGKKPYCHVRVKRFD